jgi:DNA polymerase-3 subunit epsilon
MNRFAIVDIETTGTHADTHGITEIAILVHDTRQVVESFQSLVNPESPINPFVTRLTGITNEMVRDAPKFHEVARQVWELTEGAVFVAHSVNFDYGFIHQAFKELGADFRRKKLCTVRLSRKIFPGHPSYSLGNICARLGISIQDRHRAMGDAEATVRLFEKCLAHDTHQAIAASLKRNSREAVLPPHLPREDFESLPQKTGVYYFHNQQGKVIYVGKALNIKSRVYSHFTGRESKLPFISAIARVTYELCGTELIALLFDPLYNQAQKRDRGPFVLTDYTDRRGIHHLLFTRNHLALQPLASFRSFDAAREFMFSLIEKFELCPRYCGMQTAAGACFDFQVKKCKGVCAGRETVARYNKRVRRAIESLQGGTETRLIVDEGRSFNEKSVVVVEKGMYRGFGYFDAGRPVETLEEALKIIRPAKHTSDTQRILSGALQA